MSVLAVQEAFRSGRDRERVGPRGELHDRGPRAQRGLREREDRGDGERDGDPPAYAGRIVIVSSVRPWHVQSIFTSPVVLCPDQSCSASLGSCSDFVSV